MIPRQPSTARRAAVAVALSLGLVATATPAMAAPQDPPLHPGLTAPVDLALWNTGPTERYRIPALTTAPNGDLLAFFDARPAMNDVPSPITLVMRRSTDGGRTWQPLQTIRATDGVRGYGDPSVVVDRTTGRIIVFYASSVNAGYASSRTGNDPNDPNILHVDVSTSDDHGQTWQRGSLVGPGMDENKTVELADGRVLLNIRAAGARRQAISTDGGVTYGPLTTETQQVDPGSNGAVTRVYPDAAPNDPRAQLVLLTNDEDPGIRRNVTAKLSCDSGKTWPGRVVIDPDASAYVTATPLGGGRMGLLYERDGYAKISYATLDVTAMGHQCAPMSVAATPSLPAGTTTPVAITITNHERRALPPGTLTVAGPEGWPDSTVRVPAIPPGRVRQVTVPVQVPAGVAGPRDLRATYAGSATGPEGSVSAQAALTPVDLRVPQG
ncbi:exo-alpha-sialidase [Mariniluteicoccus flavus]